VLLYIVNTIIQIAFMSKAIHLFHKQKHLLNRMPQHHHTTFQSVFQNIFQYKATCTHLGCMSFLFTIAGLRYPHYVPPRTKN
jgi:hypothetical protein